MFIENKEASFPKEDIFYLVVFVPIVILINIPVFGNFKNVIEVGLPYYIWIGLSIVINLAFICAILYIIYEILIFLNPKDNSIKNINITNDGIYIKYVKQFNKKYIKFENIEKFYFEIKMVQFTTTVNKGMPLPQKHEPMPEDCNIKIITYDGVIYNLRKNFLLGITDINTDSFFKEIKILKQKIGSDKCFISFVDTIGNVIDKW